MPEFVCFVWSLPRQCCPFPGIGPEAKSNPATLRINYGIIPKMVFIPIGLRNQKWDKYHFSGAHATVFLARIKTPLGGRPGRRELAGAAPSSRQREQKVGVDSGFILRNDTDTLSITRVANSSPSLQGLSAPGLNLCRPFADRRHRP
jgi:hypothetical protein